VSLNPAVRRVRDDEELAAALALREQVFCREQGVPLAADLDGLDGDAVQLVAVDGDGTVLGTCRVLIEPEGTARFGRLCVSAAARGHGVGGALLAEAERESRAGGARRIGMHAQTDALELYRRAGYGPYGDPFDEEGIEHVGMEKRLT
jgi:predicted GNAT family N-acyltransferase